MFSQDGEPLELVTLSPVIKCLTKITQGRKDLFWLMAAEGLLYRSWDPETWLEYHGSGTHVNTTQLREDMKVGIRSQKKDPVPKDTSHSELLP